MEYPHQAFIKKNSIEVNTLPEMLQKRIKGFEELSADVEYLVDEDQSIMEDTLMKLSHEIDEDLEEEFEEHLENNDHVEEHEPESKIVEKPVEVIKEVIREVEKKEPSTAEKLARLYQQGKRKLQPNELIEVGLLPVGKYIVAGKYKIKKGKFDSCYTLEKAD